MFIQGFLCVVILVLTGLHKRNITYYVSISEVQRLTPLLEVVDIP